MGSLLIQLFLKYAVIPHPINILKSTIGGVPFKYFCLGCLHTPTFSYKIKLCE